MQRYRQRISGPLLDRIDLQVEVPRLSFKELEGKKGESSSDVRSRVIDARERQTDRDNGKGKINARLDAAAIENFCSLRKDDQVLLRQAMERFRLSARAFHRILRVARTIADLDGEERIGTGHLTEAISFRCAEVQH